ncbi:inverted formin-2-like isoform X2 [Dysidea avara]|uniref:inverted formin-2-like isoform X2 n=1 Tax=Dysidea avara TaxID=196820 RepID=UPI0033203303
MAASSNHHGRSRTLLGWFASNKKPPNEVQASCADSSQSCSLDNPIPCDNVSSVVPVPVCDLDSSNEPAEIMSPSPKKKFKGTMHKLSVVVEELRGSETDEYRTVIMVFINCLLTPDHNAEKRTAIRVEFAALNLMDILATMRNTEDIDVATQLDVFDEEFSADQETMVSEGGMDISNHKDVFRAVYSKVVGTPNALSFLHILQHLMLLDRDSKKSNIVWEMLEKMVLSAVMMSEGNEEDSNQFVSASTEKIRKVMAEINNGEQSASIPPIVAGNESQTAPPPCAPPPPLPPGGAPPPPPLPPGGAPPPPPPPGGAPPPPPFGGISATVVEEDPQNATFEASIKFVPSKKMKVLNWKKLPRNTINNKQSVWKECVKLSEFVVVNEEQIVDLFCRAVIDSQAEKKDTMKSKQPLTVALLDAKTSLNINIFLKQFRTSNEEVVAMITQGNIEKISLEQLKAFEKLLPDRSTTEILTIYDGDHAVLGSAERFLLQLIKVENYTLRIQGMQLKLEFQEKKAELKPALETFHQAIDEIFSSESLKKVFHIILVTGNMINAGGHSGKAYGFTMTSLDNLGDTRANKPRMTFMHYIASICQEQHPDLLNTVEDLPHLEATSNLSLEYLSAQVKQMGKKLSDMNKKLTNAPEDLLQQMKGFLSETDGTIADLDDSLTKLDTKITKMAEFFCEDQDQFKVEELLSRLLKLVQQLPNLAQENIQRQKLEKKRAMQEEQQKTLDKRSSTKVNEHGGTKENEDIVDDLMKELRAGIPLRRRTMKKRQPSTISRNRRTLSKKDVARLQTMKLHSISSEKQTAV